MVTGAFGTQLPALGLPGRDQSGILDPHLSVLST